MLCIGSYFNIISRKALFGRVWIWFSRQWAISLNWMLWRFWEKCMFKVNKKNIRLMNVLTLLRSILHSHKNQSIILQFKSIGWLLYECNIGIIWMKIINKTLWQQKYKDSIYQFSASTISRKKTVKKQTFPFWPFQRDRNVTLSWNGLTSDCRCF